jgi:all-trans-retinol dehydrogenase (NAD+)
MALQVMDVFRILWGVILSIICSFEAIIRWVYPAGYTKSVKGDIVLITGGGSGIGRLMSLKLADLGAIIVTWDVNAKGNEETVSMIKANGGIAYAYTVDLCSKDKIYEAAEEVKKDVGVVKILINNAGIVSGSALLETPDEKIIRTFQVNVFAQFWTMKSFMPGMIKNKSGHIVNVASLAGHSGMHKLVDYCSSKFAAVGIDDAIKVELMVQGHADYIKTTVVCPYYISTGMFAGVQSKIIPILEPDFVAESAVQGIITNKPLVILPWWCSFLVSLKTMLPQRGFMYLSEVFGFNCSMDQFEGRK